MGIQQNWEQNWEKGKFNPFFLKKRDKINKCKKSEENGMKFKNWDTIKKESSLWNG